MDTLQDTLASVEGFREKVKLFFVDGESADGTMSFLQSFVESESNAVLISQEGAGLYQALNQGIQTAIQDPAVTHIGMLHSDDHLITGAFERYLSVIETDPSQIFYSGIEFHDASGSRVRVWESEEFSRFKLATGWMPPHTSIVVAKSVYQEIGLYNPDFGTAADYEWVVRVFSRLGEKSRYFPERTLSMLVGGASSSSLKARLRANAMDGRVWAHRSRLQSMLVRVCKPIRKIGQFKLI
jgi:glycosyltransferase